MTTFTLGAGPAAAAPGIAPDRDELVDAVAILVLTMIGVVGFRPAYGGHSYLAVGAAGVLLGLLLSHAGQRARLPLLAVVTAGILAFLLSGGVIGQTGTVSLPTLQAISSTAVAGWQQLLTTARPVGRAGGLLVLPYLLGLFSGVAGHALARRTGTVLLPAVAPAAVVALSILFGQAQPTAAVLQGAGFAAVALAWAAVRQDRGAGRGGTIGRQRPWQRIGAGAVVLAVAGAGATFVGPRLPGASAHQRVVLYVVPPLDVTQYPSPLAGYRDYTEDVPPAVSVYGKELLSTTGLPAHSLVRIATMDTYDGLTWGVADASASAGTFDGFQRVGARLPGAIPGPSKTATITIEDGYDQSWLPDLPGTTGFAFTGPEASEMQAALRVNVATTTGIISGGMVPVGLTYTVSYAAVPPATITQLANASPEGSPDPSIVIPPEVQTFAQEHAGTATSPLGKVLALAQYLQKNGRYSNGAGTQSAIIAGHSAGRLTTFLDSKQIIGDDEQYAATMALLASYAGVPARVSLDGAVESNGSVYGKDVRADIELDTAQYGWVTLPASDFTGSRAPTLQQQQVKQPPQPVKVAPPRRDYAAPVASANASSAVARTQAAPAGPGLGIPAIVITLATDAGIPVLALAALAAALVGAKALRRRRRRATGTPAARVAGAWRELVDLGYDLGIKPSAGTAGAATGVAQTRRELAASAEAHGLPSATAVAHAADAAIFGPVDPDREAVARVWALVGQARRGSLAALPRRRRAWVAVNPASLWASRAAVNRVFELLRKSVREQGSGGARGSRSRGGFRGGPGSRGHGRRRAVPGGARP